MNKISRLSEKEIHTRILSIEKSIWESYKKKALSTIGIYTGTSGLILFYYYLNKLGVKKGVEDRINILIKDSIDNIDKLDFHPTYCTGLAGFTWVLRHLAEDNQLINHNDLDFLVDIDTYLFKRMMEFLDEQNFDFLHGAGGIAYYFLCNSKNSKHKDYFLAFLNSVIKKFKLTSNIINWESYDLANNEKVINLGLSHGLPSLLGILSRGINAGIETSICQELVENTLNYIWDYKQSFEKYGSFFPSKIQKKHCPIKSRLAWCYGDLGIAIAFLNSSESLNNEKYKKNALEIIEKNAQRFDLVKEGVKDAIICHGSAGIAQIYRRFIDVENSSSLIEAYNYWINATLNFGNDDKPNSGYKTFQYDKNTIYKEESITFLEGLSGIGLCLISSISNHIGWDQALLLR